MNTIHRFIAALLLVVASVAFAANAMARTLVDVNGTDGRTRSSKGPGAVVQIAYASRPTQAVPAESFGCPIDRSPIPPCPPVPPGPSQTVSGQCFVITDRGQRIQLAQVDVRIYSLREFELYAREVDARSEARFEEMKSVACPPNFAALSLVEMDRSLAAAAVLQRDLHAVWQILPATAATTKTDAAGRFSLTHHVAQPYIVFAVGSRTFGDETEYYRWQIPSSAIRNSSQVELSNADLR
jgi:hypothetical protein